MAVCVNVPALDELFADASVEGEVDDGHGSDSEESIFSYSVCQLHSLVGHPVGYGVGEGPVASDLLCVDYCLISVPPVMLGVEVSGYVAVGSGVEEVDDVDYVFSEAGGIDYVYIYFVVADRACDFK